MKVLLIDNYDSFTFNLCHYLRMCGATVDVVRNNEIVNPEVSGTEYSGMVLSPGPGKPQDAGMLMELVETNVGKIPIMGVCLGMQAIGIYYGWELAHAEVPMHGKSSMVDHGNSGILSGLPNPFPAGRYHSLIVENSSGSVELKTEATCNGEVMAVSAEDGMVWGIQFHPESVLTPDGIAIIRNWIEFVRRYSTVV